jgi:small subunit ribosomal protein S16
LTVATPAVSLRTLSPSPQFRAKQGKTKTMAVKIRLARMGSKKRPYYRIVASDARSPRDGRFLERIGTYDPHAEKVILDEARVKYWQGVGAHPTTTVARLLRRANKPAAK